MGAPHLHRGFPAVNCNLQVQLCEITDKPVRLLDVAGGTGDIAFRLAESIRKSHVVPPVVPEIVVSDINESMLAVGRDRAVKQGYASGENSTCARCSPAAPHPPPPTPQARPPCPSWLLMHRSCRCVPCVRSTRLRPFCTRACSRVPPQFESNSFDLYTIAFGIRNVPDIPLALSEAYRVLKPGGRIMVLEFRCGPFASSPLSPVRPSTDSPVRVH